MINIKTGIKTSSRLLSPKPQYDISEHDTLFLENVNNDKNTETGDYKNPAESTEEVFWSYLNKP